jgi:hypothetical protein
LESGLAGRAANLHGEFNDATQLDVGQCGARVESLLMASLAGTIDVLSMCDQRFACSLARRPYGLRATAP